MKTCFISKIEWVSAENGGRKRIPPAGTRYCPIISLDDNEEAVIMWSIDFICPDFTKTNMIEFSFLADDAPIEKIVLNEKYYLYEGNKIIAMVYIDGIKRML